MSNFKKAATKAATKTAATPKVEVLIALYQSAMLLTETLVTAAITAEERMHSASLEANLSLLSSALKGAEIIDAEQFTSLIDALKDVSLAGIEAQKSVAMESVANGRAFIKAMESVANGTVGAFAPVAMMASTANATRAEASMIAASAREAEAGTKEVNAETERIKAETRRDNGVDDDKNRYPGGPSRGGY